MRPALQEALRRLQSDGVVEEVDGALRASRKWQSAMARVALKLYEKGDPGDDMRVPICAALLDIYGAEISDDELTLMIEAMLPVQAKSLGL